MKHRTLQLQFHSDFGLYLEGANRMCASLLCCRFDSPSVGRSLARSLSSLLGGASARLSPHRSASTHCGSVPHRGPELAIRIRTTSRSPDLHLKESYRWICRLGNVGTCVRCGSSRGGPTPPSSDPESSTDGRTACQAEGRLVAGHTGALRAPRRGLSALCCTGRLVLHSPTWIIYLQ